MHLADAVVVKFAVLVDSHGDMRDPPCAYWVLADPRKGRSLVHGESRGACLNHAYRVPRTLPCGNKGHRIAGIVISLTLVCLEVCPYDDTYTFTHACIHGRMCS